MQLSLINLNFNKLNQSIMYNYVHGDAYKVFFNFKLDDLAEIRSNFDLFLSPLNYTFMIDDYSNISKVYYCNRVEQYIPNSINIYYVLIDNGISVELIENASDILLFTLYYKLTNINVDSIVLNNFDFEESKDYIRKKALPDLKILEKILTLHTGNINSDSAKYFNLISMSLRNKLLNKNSKLDIVDLISVSDDYIESVCKRITADILEDKCFITITSKGYEWGTIALCQSLDKYHDEPVIILYSDDVDLDLIKNNISNKIYLKKVPNLQISNDRKTADRYFNTLTKFFILGLEPIKRLVYLDSDMLVRGSLQDYLDSKEDLYCSYTYEHPVSAPKMAVSIISLQPSYLLFHQFVDNAIKNPSNYSGIGDHGYFINYYKDNWTASDMESNLSQMFFGNTGNRIPLYARAIHFHGFKPWERVVGRGVYLVGSDIHDIWYNSLSQSSLINLINWFRKNEAIKEADNTLNRYLKLI